MIKSLKCPNCGAELTVNSDDKSIICTYCGVPVIQDNDVSLPHMDLETVGYRFEKGRQQALLEKKRVSITHIIIAILVLIVIILVIYIIAGNKSNASDTSTHQPTITSENEEISSESTTGIVVDNIEINSSTSSEADFYVDRIILDDEYLSLVLNKITSKGLYFDVASKMENYPFTIIVNSVALDRQCVECHCYSITTVEPGDTVEMFMEGTLNHTEHQLISISGELFKDSTGFHSFSAFDFDLGGTANEEYDIDVIQALYSSDRITVDYIGIDKRGILMQVTNNLDIPVNVYAEKMSVNQNAQDSYYSTRTYAPHTSGIYPINVFQENPDMLPEQIEYFAGHFNAFSRGIIEDEFNFECSLK